MSDIENQQENICSDNTQDDTSSKIESVLEKYPPFDPNIGTGDPTDGRNKFEWKTRYPDDARSQIKKEAFYLFFIFFISLLMIFSTWKGWTSSLLSIKPHEAFIFKKYSYYAASGMLGGVSFGIKYFYRVVARGFWHQDRIFWRLKAPWLALALAFIVGAMIDASFINSREPSSSAAIISIGFLAGYFSDEAIAKMYEIANVFFGPTVRVRAKDDK